MTTQDDARIVALDVGGKRLGVATAGVVARISQPLTTLLVDEKINNQIIAVLDEQKAVALVVGLPRGLDGQETDQTYAVRKFVEEFRKVSNIPLYWQDEALTSAMAKEHLDGRKQNYAKADVDALAASFILDDFLKEHTELTEVADGVTKN